MATPESAWIRSPYCDLGHCVEVRASTWDDTVFVRSSTMPERDVRVSRVEWEAFVAGVKAGAFDL